MDNYFKNNQLYVSLEDPFYSNKIKNRKWNGNHAQDAVLIAYSTTNPKIANTLENSIEVKNSNGEIFEKNKINNAYSNLISKDENHKFFVEGLNELVKKMNASKKFMKFSRKKAFKNNIKFHDDTLYSGKEIEGKLRKVNSKKITDIEKNDFNSFFNPESGDYLEPIIEEKDHLLWKNLKEIFEANSLEEEFPFRKAISDQIKEEKNFNFVNNNGLMINFKTPSSKNRISVVNKIRHYDKKSKNSIEILKLKNSNSFYESFDWLWIDVYKYEIDNQIHYLPVPANCNTIMIYNKKQNNENIKLERNLEKEKINNYFRNYFNLSNFNLPDIKQNKQIDYKSGYFYYVQNRLKKESDKIKEIKNFTFFHRIFRNSIILHNTYFEDGKKNIDSAAYFVGFKQSNSSLEIKKLEYHATNKNKRIRKSLQNLMKDGYVYFADLDVLGNIFNIKEIE